MTHPRCAIPTSLLHDAKTNKMRLHILFCALCSTCTCVCVCVCVCVRVCVRVCVGFVRCCLCLCCTHLPFVAGFQLERRDRVAGDDVHVAAVARPAHAARRARHPAERRARRRAGGAHRQPALLRQGQLLQRAQEGESAHAAVPRKRKDFRSRSSESAWTMLPEAF